MAKKVQAAIKNLSYVSPQIAHGNKQAAAVSELQKEMHKTADTGGVFFSVPTPYQPEFGDPSKINFPIDRHQANRYWRLFYRTDPIVGSVIDMFSEMLTSDMDLYGEGITGEVKRAYEQAIDNTSIVSLFQYFIKEFLVVGEVIPHLIFDESKGIWSDLIFHNPDQVNVLSSSFLNVPTILEFVPDEGLRKFITSQHPQVLDYIQTLPAEIVSAIASGQNVPLNTKFNVSFLARKLFPYDVRGTSIMPRMWQISMYESAIFNACFKKGTKVTLCDHTTKSIEDIKIGDVVIDKDGAKQTVEAAWEEDAESMATIELFGGYKFECTENHKWPVFAYPRTCSCGCGQEVSNRKSFVSLHGVKKLNGGWANGYLHCTHCKSIQYKHNAKGLCVHCYDDRFKGRLEYTEEYLLSFKKSKLEIPSIEWAAYGNSNTKRWSNKRLPVEYNPLQKLETKDIKKYDCLMIPRNFEETIPDNVSEEQARLLGYYLAEGYKVRLGNNKLGISWGFNINEKTTWIADIESICSNLGVKTWKADVSKSNACIVGFCRQEYSPLAEWILAKGGEYSESKVLSEDVMSWPLSLKAELIKGYIRGDGSRSGKQVKVVSSSTSINLTNQIRTILNQLGFFSGYDIATRSGYKTDHISYRLIVCNPFAAELIKLVWGITVPEKKLKVEAGAWRDADYIYVPIKDIKFIKAKEKVYNLTVSGSHSYLVNGVATYNSIQTAKRHAGPVKVLSLGSPEHQFIPPKEFFDEIVQQFTIAESDPHALIVLPNYGIKFDAFGTTDRMLSISREYDIIERIKMTALGVSAGMMHGESTFAASKTNLNTLLLRLKGMRKFFETMWFQNKFFKPLAEINEWHHRSTAEVSHRVRIKKNANEQRLIVPKIKWRQLLEPVVDKDMLEAIRLLNDLGVKSSKTTSFAAAGLDFEGETVNALTEQKIEKQLRKKILPEDVKDKRPEDIAEEILPGGAAPLSMPEELPMTPVEEGGLPEAAPAGLPPEGEAPTPEAAPGAPPITPAPASKQAPSKRGFKVTANDVDDLIDLMETGNTESQIWSYIKSKEEDNNEFIKNCNWDRINDYMEDENFSDAEIEYVRKALVRKHIIEASLNDKLEDAVETLNLAAATDAELHSKIDKTISDIFKDKIAKIQEKVKEQDDAFLTGEGNIYSDNDFLVRSGGNLSDKAIKKYRKMKKK